MVFTCAFLTACQKSAPSFKEISVEEISNASLPNVYRDSDDKLWLSYVSQHDDLNKLWLSSFENETWSEAELVAEGNNWFVNWADFPSVIKARDKFVAHWLERNAQGTYTYGVRYKIRSLSGEWQKEQWLHADNSPTEHGFVSLQAEANTTHAIWLDGRHMHSEQHVSHSNHPRLESLHDIKGMTLRYALIDAQGEVYTREELDSLTCDCCQTTSVLTSKGLVIAYRDREVKTLDSEIRDIKVLRQVSTEDGYAWLAAKNTPVDNWDIQACPVNGPMLSARDEKIVLAWFTAADGQSKVHLAFSSDGAESFADKLVIDESNNLGRVGVDWISAETVVISWLGSQNAKSVLFFRLVNIDGSMSEKQAVTEIDMSRVSGVPQVTQVNENEFMLLWTKAGQQSSIMSQIIQVN